MKNDNTAKKLLAFIFFVFLIGLLNTKTNSNELEKLESITIDIFNQIENGHELRSIEEFYKQSINSFNMSNESIFLDDMNFLGKSIQEAKSSPEIKNADDFFKSRREYEITHLYEFIQFYQKFSKEKFKIYKIVEVKRQSHNSGVVIFLQFDGGPTIGNKSFFNELFTYEFKSTAINGIHPINGIEPGMVYQIHKDENKSSLLGHIPGRIYLPFGLNKLRVFLGRSHYDLEIIVKDRIAIITKFDFRDSYPCWALDTAEVSALKRTQTRLEGKKVRWGQNRELSLPYHSYGRDPCMYSLSFGSAKFYALSLNSVPAEASIIIDGTVYGVTPQKIMIRRNFRSLKVILRKEGHADAAIDIDLNDYTSGKPIKITAHLNKQ